MWDTLAKDLSMASPVASSEGAAKKISHHAWNVTTFVGTGTSGAQYFREPSGVVMMSSEGVLGAAPD